LGKASGQAAGKASKKASEKASDKASGKAPEKASEKAPEKASGKASDKASGKASEKASEKAQEKAAGKPPEIAPGDPSDAPEGRPGQPAVPRGHRAGFVAIIGAPNAGKSSLMNRLLGRKVAIVTAKPQTTRHRVLGVMTGPSGQLAFIDTPGVHRSDRLLNQAMVSRARSAMADADVCLWLVDGGFRGRDHREALEAVLARGAKPLVVAVNKCDLLDAPSLEALVAELAADLPPAGSPGAPSAVLACSAATGRGLGALRKALLARLPKSPPLYDEDALTDQSLRALAAELVREAVFELSRQEIPYSTAVTVDSFKEPGPSDPKPICRIEATIHVERDSQKLVVVGAGGSMIKRIGRQARLGLEDLLGGPVYLALFVRVTRDWSSDGRLLGELGYADE
jgi:GTP-binding protein Era